MQGAVSLIQVLRRGGSPPPTAGNPRPTACLFGHVLGDEDTAEMLTYIRGSWGNDVAAVTRVDLIWPDPRVGPQPTHQ